MCYVCHHRLPPFSPSRANKHIVCTAEIAILLLLTEDEMLRRDVEARIFDAMSMITVDRQTGPIEFSNTSLHLDFQWRY